MDNFTVEKHGENGETADCGQPGKKSGRMAYILLFLLIFALGFGAVGAALFRTAHKEEKTYSTAAEGRVVDYEGSTLHGKRMYSPIVEYQVGGRTFSGSANVWYNLHPFREGESVTVYYDPQNPADFYLKEEDPTFGLGAIFLLFSLGVIVVVVLFVVLGKVKMEAEKRERIRGKVFAAVVVLVVFGVFTCFLGIVKAVCVFVGMGLLGLYGLHRDGRKK